LLASEVASQIAEHEKYGGVVPEVASRNHLVTMTAVIERAMAETRRLLAADDRHALHAAVGALNRATEEFAARRMDRGVAQALTGRSVDALS